LNQFHTTKHKPKTVHVEEKINQFYLNLKKRKSKNQVLKNQKEIFSSREVFDLNHYRWKCRLKTFMPDHKGPNNIIKFKSFLKKAS
jgi:hypothetical protein